MRGGASAALRALPAALLLAVLPADALRFTTVDIPDHGPLLDAGVDGRGTVVLLYRGFPRVVRLEEGSSVELDLAETEMPGGLCVMEGDQMLVSDRSAGLVRRYGPGGALLSVMDAPGSPGDVAMVGLEVWFFSREECLVRAAGEGGRVVFRPPGECVMSLSGGTLVGTAASESAWRLRPGDPPELLAGRCLDATILEGVPVVLLDSMTALRLPSDTLALPTPVSRASGSSGGWLLLWSPSSGTALLAR